MNNFARRLLDVARFWAEMFALLVLFLVLAAVAVAVLGADSAPGTGTPTTGASSGG